jgi:HK97 gp10 family phage protein
MADRIEVSGLTELREALKTLPEALQGKASQIALTKAARPIVRAAQQKAPTRKPRGFMGPMRPEKTKGRLRASIYSFRNRESTKTFESRLIGVKGRAWYWRFIEFGRASISRAKGSLGTPVKGFFGKVVKAVPARPFLRPAFEENANRAIELYRDALLPAIEKTARKAFQRSQRRLRKYITGF